jgi:2-keto-4-pentenoate hydratase
MSFDPGPAAAALMEARMEKKPAGPLPAGIAPPDLAASIAVQREIARRQNAIPPAGFKIGATTKRMQEYLGLDGPAAGFMLRENLHAGAATLPFASLRGPGAECELGVRLARDLAPGPCDIERARAAVGDLFAAMEIVENRYGPPPAGDLKAVGTPTMIADQVYHRAAILGAPPADWRALDLQAIPGRISVDGAERASGHGADLLGHPLAALAWLAASEAARAFGGLRAGQVVMLGSVTPPIWLDGPCTVLVHFDGLSEVRLHLT